MKLSLKTINDATVLSAIYDIEKANKKATAALIGEVLLRPQNFDMGKKLFSMANKTIPLIDARSDGTHNVYSTNKHSKEYLENYFHRVQEYGNYESAGADIALSPSSTAEKALSELQGIIRSNAEAKKVLVDIYNKLDNFLELKDAK